MKTSAKLKIIAAILFVILILLVSFGGLYVKNGWRMKDIIKDYSFGMGFSGYKTAVLSVDLTEKEVEVEAETEEGEEQEEQPADETEGEESEEAEKETEMVPVNAPELLTEENYKKSKEIMNTRLKQLKAIEYTIRQNKQDGTVFVDIINNGDADYIIQNIYGKGIFEVKGKTDETVYLTNANVKNAKVGYTTGNAGETYLVLSITLNKEGKQKLEEISEIYTTSENILSICLDGNEFGQRYFEEKETSGELRVALASSENTDLESITPEAKYMAHLIKSEPMPLTYIVDSYLYTNSSIDGTILISAIIVGAVIFLIITICFMTRYKFTGLLSMVGTLGYIGLLLILIRVTNVVISESGMFAIILSAAIQMLLMVKILETRKNEKSEIRITINSKVLDFIKIMGPILIISIIFAFLTWLPINSFGIVLFWGFVLNILLALTIVKVLFYKGREIAKGGKAK